jgi:HlyD family secretion protein
MATTEKNKGDEDQPPHLPRLWRWGLLILVAIALLWGIYGHWHSYATARETQRHTSEFVPTVRTADAQREDGPQKLSLPGETQAFDSASLYARATGYIAERKADIGSRVKKGDLLMRISAPDLDAQLLQAQAQLAQAKAQLVQSRANLGLAQTTDKRTTTLAGQGYASRQDADNSTANVAVNQASIQVGQANVEAQNATVQRLKELISYERVTAPFDGVVTGRSIDVGDLVNADQGSGTALFTLAADDVLRVSVQVPQSAALALKDGLDAEIRVPEIPDRAFKGKVARSSVALNTGARTMLVQVDVPNDDHALRAGLYVTIVFDIPRQQPGVMIPDQALIFDSSGQHVAVMQQDGTVKMQPVTIYRDMGTTAELQSGLQGGEKLVLSPPATLADGAKVNVAQDQDKDQKQDKKQ